MSRKETPEERAARHAKGIFEVSEYARMAGSHIEEPCPFPDCTGVLETHQSAGRPLCSICGRYADDLTGGALAP